MPRIVRAGDLGPARLREAVLDGRLVRVLRGYYTQPPAAGAPWERDRHLLLARAAAVHRHRGGEHWFSHETAALLWGCATVQVPVVVDVTGVLNPHVRRGTVDGVRTRWTADAAARADVTGELDLPASSLARTVVDCAATLRAEHGLVVADSALRAGLDPDAVAAVLARSAGRRGIRRARDVLALADGRAESPGESLLRWLLLDAGLPAPELQVAVSTRLGWRWVDLGWPEARLALEFDGAVKYAGGRAVSAEAVVAEKRRQDALEEEEWRVLRIVWADLRDPVMLTARIRRVLADRQWRPIRAPG